MSPPFNHLLPSIQLYEQDFNSWRIVSSVTSIHVHHGALCWYIQPSGKNRILMYHALGAL
jgi:hypothetical protein